MCALVTGVQTCALPICMVETIVRRDLNSEAGWDWKLHDLPDAPETYFLQNLLAEHRFQEALKNYRDVRMLTRNVESWRVRLDGIAHDYIATERPAGAIGRAHV